MKEVQEVGSQTALVGSIQKFSIQDGPGIRSTVFFKGCPLSCKWCHNPELISDDQQLFNIKANCIGCGSCIKVCPNGAISPREDKGVEIDRDKCDVCLKCTEVCYPEALRAVSTAMTVDDILAEAAKDKSFYDSTGGGITLSGGETLERGDFIRVLIDRASEMGIGICLDTCGHWDSEFLLELARHPNVTDILYDIKSVDDEVHIKYTGVSNKLILSNLKEMAKDDSVRKKINIRMPLISKVNDSEDQLKGAGELLRELKPAKLTLLPYHDLGAGKKRNLDESPEVFAPPSDERLADIAEYFKKTTGMEVEILGWK